MSLFAELNRRNVLRVAATYLVLGWVVLQVGDVLFDALELPPVWNRAIVGLLVLGFIPAVVFSWVYELTPEGLKKESEIERGEGATVHTAEPVTEAIDRIDGGSGGPFSAATPGLLSASGWAPSCCS